MSSLREQIAGLVHVDVQCDPVERARHETFIAARLASSFAALAILPPYIVCCGLPPFWAAAAFAWLVVPLAAVAVLCRSGNLVRAQALCSASLVCLCLTVSAGSSSPSALWWLVLVPLEATLAGSPGLTLGATVATLGAAAFVWLRQVSTLDSVAAGDAVMVLPAVAYAMGLAFAAQHVADVARATERSGGLRQAALVAAAGDMVVWVDRGGSVTSADDAPATLRDFPPAELQGRGLFNRINVADRPAYLTAVANALGSSQPTVATVRVCKGSEDNDPAHFASAAFAWVELRMMRAPNGASRDEAAPGAICVVRDISRHRPQESDLDVLRATAERADGWKDRFLANVSHELRTPLNAIIGFSEMLGSADLVPRNLAKQREYAQIIRTSGEHLLAVVNSILDISKIESGSFDIVSEHFEVGPLIDASCDIVRLKAEEGRIELVREIDAKLPELVADKRACKQILINLLSNAVKFTPPAGHVTIGAKRDGPDLVFFVNDTGVGITPRDLPRLGDRFFQAHDMHDRRFEGTGLGLSVVRGLVGLHGGTIAVESAPGEGTRVSVRLPIDGRRSRPQTRSVARIETSHRKAADTPPPAESLKQTVKKSA